MMEPTFNIQKRPLEKELVLEKCLICQKVKRGEKLRQSTSVGRSAFQDALSKRTKYKCEQYSNFIDLMNYNLLILSDESLQLKWHKTCFSSFTSSSNLKSVQRQFEQAHAPNRTEQKVTKSTSFLSRRLVPAVEWDKCVFCQESGGNLSQVLTFGTSNKILEASECDLILGCRLAGVSDLVAAEVKYHLNCYSKALRQVDKVNQQNPHDKSPFNKTCLITVIKELQNGLKQGNIYSIKTVWNRYSDLVSVSQSKTTCDPDSNTLRSFRNEIVKHCGDTIELIAQQLKSDSMLIFPYMPKNTLANKLCQNVVDLEAKETEYTLLKTLREVDIDKDFLLSMQKISSNIRSEINDVKSHSTYDGIDHNHVQNFVPPNLYTLLSMIIGNNEDDKRRNQIFSIAQDVIYVASGGKTLTPKHVGLASTVHHATRNKGLVQLLHTAGHCASYETVERVETTIAKQEIDRWKENGNLVIPHNLVSDKFIQFAADNINISIETLDGKGMFNATQYAAFQNLATPKQVSNNQDLRAIGTQRSFGPSIPPEFHKILPSHYNSKQRPPPILPPIDVNWFIPGQDLLNKSKVKDLAWLQCRMMNSFDEQMIPAWTGFNQIVSTFQSEPSEVGYMPIIPAPADDMDTVFTVLTKCQAISQSLGQRNTIITFDEALYFRAKEICWLKPHCFENVIIRLGGFHILMTFMKCIGKHMDSSGLKDIWVESGVFGENSTTHMLTGHAYNKAVRGHKLTFEVLWRILWPKFLSWLETTHPSHSDEIQVSVDSIIQGFTMEKNALIQDAYDNLVNSISGIIDFLQEFDNSNSQNPMFRYWREYMDMVSILLGFIRAEREGNWELHLETFSKMLPWLAIYDHVNYSRWGPVYLADMMQLPTKAPDVYHEFCAGNFSIKRSTRSFSQISTDQALEHINKLAKVSGGIVGITQLDSSRDRWCVTYNERARISDDTLALFDLQHHDTNNDWRHRDIGQAGLKRDELDVQKLKDEFIKCNIFSRSDGQLVSLLTGDVATDEIMTDILQASEKGEALVNEFVKERLVETSPKNLYAKIPQNKSKTLGTLYKVNVTVKKDTKVVLKTERDIFRRLLVASDSGRTVDLASMLCYELSPVPLSLAGTNRKLHSTSKSVLIELLTQSVKLESQLPKSDMSSCMVIDGHALIQSLGKPDGAQTFGDLADRFFNNITRPFQAQCARVDVVFDRYFDSSIKDGTRATRMGNKSRPIRRIIESCNVKLPFNWGRFIGLSSNKAELASFISSYIITKADQIPEGCELVLGGGFSDATSVWSSSRQNLGSLQCNHEEADTRLILHANEAKNAGYDRVVIKARDTDVLVLALGHRDKLSKEVWMSSGTVRDPKFIPVHGINLPAPVIENLMAYHAITGCDTTSQFTGKGKKTTWKIFEMNAELLKEIGETPECSEQSLSQAEDFVCHMYGHGGKHSINEVRLKLFVAGKCSIDGLPPTQDALYFHLKRANYQTFIWKQATTTHVNLPSPNDHGWTTENNMLIPILMSLDPVPMSCKELVSCSCKSGCGTSRCGCLKKSLLCISACNCQGLCQNYTEDDNLNESQ